ncbi:MAG: 50S ribosomal protein L4 [Dehalococcoidia bacterium]|nr:50S ribosomal protein L4 [Dehalococcoidia bacterium]
MQVPVYNLAGEVVKNIDISDDVFAVPQNEAVVHQALVRQLANARQGTVDTKTRAEVAGSGRKLYQQKHTGHSRAGDIRSPLRRHGGIIFGPHPRDYSQDMPKKMRRLAIRCALSAKAGDGELKVLETLDFEKPRTKEMAKVLDALSVNSTALIVTTNPSENVILSARNIPSVKTLPANLLNIVDLTSHKLLVMTEAAVRVAEQLWGKKPSQEESSASV